MVFEKEESLISESLATEEIRDLELTKRLERYSIAKARSFAMSEYIKSTK